MSLEERYKDDPVLLNFYKKGLLIKGWAGKMDDVEREYVARMNPPWYASAIAMARKGRAARGLTP